MKREKESSQGKKGFLECIWMLARVVDFKLCDREYECESCWLDIGIRQTGNPRVPATSSRPGSGTERLPGAGTGVMNIRGYSVPSTLFYHPRHSWARIEQGGRVRVGLDDFGQKLAGRFYSVLLPAPGTEVGPGCENWRIVHSAGETVLTTPVRGVVEERNTRLSQLPSLVNRDPYGNGAAFVVKPVDLVKDLKGLYYGKQVERWCENEIETLHGELLRLMEKHAPVLGQTLQDGGVHIADLSAEIGAPELQRLIDRFLSVSASSLLG
jgi:glycine cleavage system H lipoate-binding protein